MAHEGPPKVVRVDSDFSTQEGALSLGEEIALRADKANTSFEASLPKQDNSPELNPAKLDSETHRSPLLESGPSITETIDSVEVFHPGNTIPLSVFEKPSETASDAPERTRQGLNEKVLQITKLFSPAILERLKNAPETVRSAATKAYEGLSSTPLIGHALGKTEMAYSQIWIERHEQKALNYKEKFDRHDATLKTLEQSKSEVETQMNDMVAKGIPGADSLQLFLQKIDTQKMSVLQKREAVESKIKDRQDKISNYTEKRDRIADRFIAKLDEKLQPHQERMRGLDASKAECELEISSAKARHSQELSELKTLSDKKSAVVSALIKAGLSQRQIDTNLAVVNIEKHITEGRKRVRYEMEKLDAKLSKVSYQTAQVKKKSSPFEQKRSALERIKNGRRVQINLPTTETVIVDGALSEPIEESAVSTPTDTKRNQINSSQAGFPTAANDNASETYERSLSLQSETGFTTETQPRIETPTAYLKAWNNHVGEYLAGRYPELHIDGTEFLKKTRLKPNTKLTSKRFYKLINSYYKTKGVNQRLRNRVLHNFSGLNFTQTQNM